MMVSVEPSLVRDNHSLAHEASSLSQSLLHQAFECQAEDPDAVLTVEMTQEGMIRLSTLLMMLSNGIKQAQSS
jgi:hypothetical protein